MDIPDLSALSVSLGRCVEPGGIVAVTLLHPAFWNQSPAEDPDTGDRHRKVTGYLDHEEWWVTSFGGHRHYHRPLGFYVDWLTPADFAVIDLFEPPVPWPTPADEQTDYERWFTSIPTMIGIAFTRLNSSDPPT